MIYKKYFTKRRVAVKNILKFDINNGRVIASRFDKSPGFKTSNMTGRRFQQQEKLLENVYKRASFDEIYFGYGGFKLKKAS